MMVDAVSMNNRHNRPRHGAKLEVSCNVTLDNLATSPKPESIIFRRRTD